MMDAATQMIDFSPGPSHSGESSDSEESSGLEIPSNQPTQLIHTELLDSNDGYGEEMYDAGRTQQLDNMYVDTQLMDDDDSYDFGDRKGVGDDCTMLIPSEDEGSKGTQLMTADDGDSGTSSAKDDEVDSGLSSYPNSLTDKTSDWPFKMAANREMEEGPANDFNRYSCQLHQDHIKPWNFGGAVPPRSGEVQIDFPPFVKDPDRNQSFGFNLVGHSDESDVRNRKGSNEEQPSVVVVLPINPDENAGKSLNEEFGRHPNTSSTDPGEANSSQNLNCGRLSAYSSGNFCQQDLNKSPEPETQLMDDDWGGVNGEDLGIIGRIDEGASNVGSFDRHQPFLPLRSSPPLENRTSEGVPIAENRSLRKANSNTRTPGSIRTASLRASALRTSSYSSSFSRHLDTPGVSQSEEVQKVEKDGNDAPTCGASSAGFVTPASVLSRQEGIPSSAVSQASVRSTCQDGGQFSGQHKEIGIMSGNVKERTATGESSLDKHERSNRISPIGSQSSKSAESQSLNRARKLFSGNEQEDVLGQGEHEEMQQVPSKADKDEEKEREPASPSITDSQSQRRMERRRSLGSGLFSQNSEMSYLNFQSPGEDSQARALNMVDKLVWLNATGLSQELQLEEENATSHLPSNAKTALQSRLQVAEAKAPTDDPFGVFDWVDSQHDEAGIFFGSKGASALKAAPRSAGTTSNPKQVGVGMRRPGVLDASGLRMKTTDKTPEIPSKLAANPQRPRAPLPKSAAGSKVNKSDQQMQLGKVSATGGQGLDSGEPERVEAVTNTDASGWRVANRAFRDSEGPNNVETAMPQPELPSKTARLEKTGSNALPRTGTSHQVAKLPVKPSEAGSSFKDGSKSLAHAEQRDERDQQLHAAASAEDMPGLNLCVVFSPLRNDGTAGEMASADLSGKDTPRMLSGRDDQTRVSEGNLLPRNPESTARDRSQNGAAESSGEEEADGGGGAPASVSSPEKEAEVTEVPAVGQQPNMGPDTLGAVEAMGMMISDFPATTAGRPEEASRDDDEASEDEDEDDDKTAGVTSETDDGILGRHFLTRRSRTQGRRSAAGVGTIKSRNEEHEQPKSRTRRVTWAGPLEQAPSNAVITRCRSARQQENTSAEQPNHEQVENAVTGAAANGDRKRKAKASEHGEAKDHGTDEDQDEDEMEVSPSTGVKTRSLSHMQPPEDEVPDSSKVKVGKGLRSLRSRGDEGSIDGKKRRRACSTPNNNNNEEEEETEEEERTGSPCDTDAAQTSVEGKHTSENEAAVPSGRRRMRSIADVSSLSTRNRGSRRGGRGRRPRPSRPAVERKADHSDADPLLPPVPPSTTLSSALGRPRGKGGPRSARKRKELDPLKGGGLYMTSPTSSREASTSSSKETVKRTRGETVAVLFSHGLAEDVGKKQRKIVSKLGGTVTTSALVCTHFVADKFVRTGNMLEAMAAGKPVVTPAWLESCLHAKCYVDEHPYILRDAKKESEMGFSMVETLVEAQKRPLLQGIRVYITPGTTPGPDALAKIVRAAGGEVVNKYDGPAPDGDRTSDFCLVLASEEEFELCTPLLEQGAKVFTSELLLSGVMCHNLDFSNDQLFQNFSNKRRRASLSRRIF
ncbi:hypothetical protein R1sor_004140 [Riccia sorocarpa]|uniref:BRCT domain-containing protein n=1 Tax=Riccia sorocarpa TaxID=122646 RepID=A0ABD3H3N0_9MARC